VIFFPLCLKMPFDLRNILNMVGMALFVVGGELRGLVGGREDRGGREKGGVS